MLIICNKCKQLKYVSRGEGVCLDCKIKMMTREQEEELENDLEDLDEEEIEESSEEEEEC